MATPQDILVDNLKETLKASQQYILWGNSAAIFLLIMVIQDWKGVGVAAITVPGIGLTAERFIVETLAVAAYFISGFMAYISVSRVVRIKARLHGWSEIRKAVLTYPSIPTINLWLRIVPVVVPVLLNLAAWIIIYLPKLNEQFGVVLFHTFLLGVPYLGLIQILRYPLSETSYMLTGETLKELKTKGVPEGVLEKIKGMQDKEYENRPMFLKSLTKMIGGNQVEKFGKIILKHACDEEGIAED